MERDLETNPASDGWTISGAILMHLWHKRPNNEDRKVLFKDGGNGRHKLQDSMLGGENNINALSSQVLITGS